jgi:hypothetical protein
MKNFFQQDLSFSPRNLWTQAKVCNIIEVVSFFINASKNQQGEQNKPTNCQISHTMLKA